jgi:hypothetical protein
VLQRTDGTVRIEVSLPVPPDHAGSHTLSVALPVGEWELTADALMSE